MKVHHPAPFFAARLANLGGYHHPAVYMAEARRLGIPIHPPHINHSGRRFTLEMAGREGTGGTGGAWEPSPSSSLSSPTSLSSPGSSSFVSSQSSHNSPSSPSSLSSPSSPSSLSSPSSPSSPSPPLPSLWMGLGQVRELRRASVRAILAARRRRPFTSLHDLLNRVELQAKEVQHLVQCGALDGLGASRADMLAQVQEIRRAGSVLQGSFNFDADPLPRETAAQRLAWESHLLGWPVSVTPLDALEELPAGRVELADLPATTGQRVVAGYRLPGWTGGKGFFLSDGRTYVTAVVDAPQGSPAERGPRPWQPIRAQGRWLRDHWGVETFAVADWTPCQATDEQNPRPV